MPKNEISSREVVGAIPPSQRCRVGSGVGSSAESGGVGQVEVDPEHHAGIARAFDVGDVQVHPRHRRRPRGQPLGHGRHGERGGGAVPADLDRPVVGADQQGLALLGHAARLLRCNAGPHRKRLIGVVELAHRVQHVARLHPHRGCRSRHAAEKHGPARLFRSGWPRRRCSRPPTADRCWRGAARRSDRTRRCWDRSSGPPLPPTWTCTGPCGCASSCPKAGPWCANPVCGPPNPTDAPWAAEVNCWSASACSVLVTTSGRATPSFTDFRRSGTNSGFGVWSGRVPTRKAGGNALPGDPLL